MKFSPLNKPRISTELQILTYLNSRMNLSKQDRLSYKNLHKGYIGEKKFYHLLAKGLSIDCLILSDLLLKNNHTEFQIDHLLICQNKIYLFEVKNFEGDFYIQNDHWYVAATGKEIRNPLLQLQRTEFLFRHLLEHLGFDLEIKSYIILINKEFMLYQAPFNQLSIRHKLIG